MNDLKLEAIDTEGFSALPSVCDGSVVVRLLGNCDLESTPLLDRFLSELHQGVRRAGLTSVVLDCHELYFMNASSVKYFVTWLSRVRELDEGERYKVRFVTNSNLTWQRRSLEALRRFASDLVSIDN